MTTAHLSKTKQKYKRRPELLIKYDNMQSILYMYTQCKQNMHSPVYQTQLFREAVYKIARAKNYQSACEDWKKDGNVERLKMPEIQVEAPEPQFPDDADLMALLNMDGSLDILNSSLFRF